MTAALSRCLSDYFIWANIFTNIVDVLPIPNGDIMKCP